MLCMTYCGLRHRKRVPPHPWIDVVRHSGHRRRYGFAVPIFVRICPRYGMHSMPYFTVTFINKHGLFQGGSQEMRAEIGDSLQHDKSKELAERLIAFVSDGEQQLRDGERLPMSTEILESSFGLYKQLERQHSKSGFTSLLACFPALLKPTTPELVTAAFGRVSRKDVQAWVKQHFSSTVSSRRRSAYSEHKKAATAPAIVT